MSSIFRKQEREEPTADGRTPMNIGNEIPPIPVRSNDLAAPRTRRKTENTPSRPRVNIAGIILAGTVGAVVLAGVAAIVKIVTPYWDYSAAAKELPAAIARARELNMPLVASDLAPHPPVLDSENAAPQLRALNAQLSSTKYDRDIATAQEALLEGNLLSAERAIAPEAKAMAMAEAAARRPRIDWGRDWDLGPALLFPELAGVKSSVKLLCVRSEIRAKTGDIEGALADLHTADMLSMYAGSDPTIISMLVGIACESIRAATIEHIAEAWAGDSAKLARLAEATANSAWHPALPYALKGEAYMAVATMRNFGMYGGERGLLSEMGTAGESPMPQIDPNRLLRSGEPDSLRARAYLARNLQLWEGAWPTISTTTDPTGSAAALDRMADFAAAQKGLSYKVAQIMFPVFSQAGNAIVKLDARNRTTSALLKVLQFRDRQGRYPRTLAEAGANAIDPFDGKPLRYLIAGEGVRVYSVGSDKIDDGGQTHSEMSAKNKGRNGEYGDEVSAYPTVRQKHVRQANAPRS